MHLNARGNNPSPVPVTRPGRSPHVGAGILALWMAAAPAGGWTAGASEHGSQAAAAWAVEDGEVRIRCPLTVGGSFDATTSAISGRLVQTTSAPPAESRSAIRVRSPPEGDT